MGSNGRLGVNDRVKEPGKIPLKCNLCPKEPTFSDLSHLLTHVSSKSHLHNYHQCELRVWDSDAVEQIRTFDEWYVRYEIKRLEQDRLRNSGKRGQTPFYVPLNHANVDEEEAIKAEHDELVAPYPLMGHSSSRSSFDSSGHAHHFAPYYDHADPGELIPSNALVLRRPQSATTGTSDTPLVHDPAEHPTELQRSRALAEKLLKGLRLPGMWAFDSAPEAKKKQRNQKKDDSALRIMKATSVSVERIEVVWNALGSLQRTRDIYDPPSIEGTPVSEDYGSSVGTERRAGE